MISKLLEIYRDRNGATAIEYGLILSLISIFVVAWATEVGTSISGFFIQVGDGL